MTHQVMKKQFLGRILYAFLIALSHAGFAQENTVTPDTVPLKVQETVSLESVNTKIAEIQANEELEEALKTTLLEIYKKAQSQLKTAQSFKETAKSYEQSIQSAPEEIKVLEENLQQLQKQSTELSGVLAPPVETSSKELDASLNEQLTNLASLETALYELKEKNADQQNEPVETRRLIDETQKKIKEIDSALKPKVPAVDKSLEAEARRTAQLAQREAHQAQLRMLNQKLLSHDLRSKQLALEEKVQQLQLETLSAQAKRLKIQADQARLREAEKNRKEAELARKEALGKHPAIIELAEENAKLSKTNTLIAQRIKQIEPEIEQVREQIKEVTRDYENAQKQIAIVGLSEELAEILLNQRQSLQNIKRDENAVEKRKNEISSVGLNRFLTDEALKASSNLKLVTEQIFNNKVDPALKTQEKNEIKAQIATLVQKKYELLTDLKENYGTLLRHLGDLVYEENRSIEKIEAYASFLDERLLWIPNSAPLDLQDLSQLLAASKWFLSVDNWREILSALIHIPIRAPFATGLAFFVFLYLFFNRNRLLGIMESYREKLNDISTDRFAFTLSASGITLLLACPIALLLTFVGWQIMEANTSSDFVKGTGYGLLCLAATLFGLRFLQNLCRSKGLAETHFQLKETTTRHCRKHIRWFMPLALVTTFVVAFMEWQPNEDLKDSLGRLAFVTGTTGFAIFIHCLIRPNNGIFTAKINARPDGWLSRLRKVWHPLAVGLPIALAGMAISGYYYTALQLELRTAATLWLLVGIIILYHLCMRWLVLKEKKIALEQKNQQEIAAQENKAQDDTDTNLPKMEVPEINLNSLNQQSVKLLRSSFFFLAIIGIWLIWASVLPALNFLNSVELWQQTVIQNGENISQPITLARLLFGLIISVLTIVAAKNIPGILEIAILRNLPLLPGTRYAWVILCQYTLVLIGFITVFNVIGINWANIGWIVAALSVGLGFGLQEIVANFVCGILLLAERPIRVGDIVTVSDTTGIVSKIRIRATTIVNWDRKELLVPNKEFITGRILNWTLSNQVTRIVVTVGIAYGSDTEKAREILLQTAKDHPEVLDDPAPVATFDQFGDSSLELNLRCYLPSLEKRLITSHELHTVIHKRFAEEGIEIPFPQRDLHLRTVESVIDVKTSDGSPNKKILETRVSSTEEPSS